MSLYVGNLHPDCNDDILYKKFSLIGKVSSVKVCRDSVTLNSLGYGYVNFSSEEDAKKAIDNLNYDLLYGRAIRIMWAHKNPNALSKSANIVVKNLDPNMNELDLKQMFSPFGEIVSIKVATNMRGDSKGYGFVQFSEEGDADWAISSMNGADVRGRKLTISKFIPVEERKRFQQTTFPNNVCVSNLNTTSSEELEKICEAFGQVMSAKVLTDDKNRSRGIGFVSFKDKHSAERAIQQLNRLCLNGKIVSAQFVNNASYEKSS